MYAEKSTSKESPSEKVKILGGSIDGGSFTGFTVITKISESSRAPSLTATEMFTSPFQSRAGVNVNVVPSTSAITLPSSDTAV